MEGLLDKYCILPVTGCISLLLMFVLSLYVWQNTHFRNDPSVIKKRFLSVLITSILSPFAIYLFSKNDFVSKYSVLDILGIRFPGLFMALTVPLILTMILFLGPLSMQSQADNWQLYSENPQQNVSPSNIPQMNSLNDVSSHFNDAHGVDNNKLLKVDNTSENASAGYSLSGTSLQDSAVGSNETSLPRPSILNISSDADGLPTPSDALASFDAKRNDERDDNSEPMYWLDSCRDMMWLRDHVVAPFSEELTFRACMLPLLLQCFRPQTAVFVCPLFFGLAHFHHVYGRVKTGYKLKTAILVSGFQFLFTTMFGAYSAFLFLRTGHIVAPFIAHAFCNHIGFPNFREIWFYNEPKRSITCILCVIGLIAWCCLLEPLTNPLWYKNTIYWKV